MTYPTIHKFNEMYTPDYALDYLVPFVPKDWRIREMCPGQLHMVGGLVDRGYEVLHLGDKVDSLTHLPDLYYDCIITNPPRSNHNAFIKRAMSLDKPFAFLIRLEHLGGVEIMSMLRHYDFNVIIPERRIHYITPNSGKSSPFHSIRLLHGIPMEEQITYVALPSNNSDKGK